MYFDEFEDFPEPYENDLEDLMDREAFEDAIAERESFQHEGVDPDSDYDLSDYAEDRYLDSAYEDRTELGHMEDFGDY